MARSIQIAHWQAGALREIAVVLVQGGQTEQALAMAHSIEDADGQARAVWDIAVALNHGGKTVQALAVARSIQDADRQCNLLCFIAVKLAIAGQFEQALAVADSIQDAAWQAEALPEIAAGLAQAGQGEQARSVFVQLLSVVRPFQDGVCRSETLPAFAVALAEAGQIEQASSVFEQVLELARSTQNSFEKGEALWNLAAALAQTGETEEAVSAAGSIQDAYLREQALRGVAVAAGPGRTDRGSPRGLRAGAGPGFVRQNCASTREPGAAGLRCCAGRSWRDQGGAGSWPARSRVGTLTMLSMKPRRCGPSPPRCPGSDTASKPVRSSSERWPWLARFKTLLTRGARRKSGRWRTSPSRWPSPDRRNSAGGCPLDPGSGCSLESQGVAGPRRRPGSGRAERGSPLRVQTRAGRGRDDPGI